jgi:hydrogenase/urease accessory protein HupE
VIVLGVILFRRNPLRTDFAFALFAAAGLLDGYGLGESIAAADRSPAFAFFIGLALMQSSIALAAMFGARMIVSKAGLYLLLARIAGAFAIGAGGAVILQHTIPGA